VTEIELLDAEAQELGKLLDHPEAPGLVQRLLAVTREPAPS
jgi:hypothetical protein